ncbi:MAG: hypothetical protein Q7V01_05275 [Vicinamibacterales bacterium]|nr:hypothetical protein [Vicinamibacterales bacterium]
MGFYGALVPKEAFSKAVWATLRAREIDETLAEAHAQLAMLRKELDYNWPEVHRELARAIDLGPRSPVVRLRRAIAGLMPCGRLAEAIADIELVLDTDPLSPFIRWWLATMHFLAGDGARAVGESDRLMAIEPGYAPACVPPSVIAWISLALGDLDDGFGRMGEAYDVRDPLIMPIRSYPFLVPLRGDSRYQALLERMNLA